VQAVAIAHRVEQTSDDHFGFGVAAGDAPHARASLGWGQSVGHAVQIAYDEATGQDGV
jgi:hypothetical protein